MQLIGSLYASICEMAGQLGQEKKKQKLIALRLAFRTLWTAPHLKRHPKIVQLIISNIITSG